MFPVNVFEWVGDTSQFNDDFINRYNEEGYDEGYFYEVAVQYPEKFHDPQNDLPFLTGRMKIEKVYIIKLNI